MKRQGFTMIELVFIIVILGILGAIAVPKMAASRLDAKAVALKTDIGTITQAFPAMALSQGKPNELNFTTNSAVSLNKGNWEVANASEAIIYSPLKNDGTSTSNLAEACVTIGIAQNQGSGRGTKVPKNAPAPASPKSPSEGGIADNAWYLWVYINQGSNLCSRIGTHSIQYIPLSGTSVLF